jgi:UDP:flavonoid glycosyltransferase YjiC (YdhE family)
VLAQGVPGLDHPRPDLPSSVHYVGRLAPTSTPSGSEVLPRWWPELAQARAEDRPVVHVAQGTLHVDPTALIRPTVEALADSPALVVVATGRLVVAGADLDKPEVARRVVWSGAGIDLRTGRPRPARIRRAVDAVLADPGMRAAAQRLSRQLEEAGGAARATDLVEVVTTTR